MADAAPLGADPDRLIARAIESVLESVPDIAGDGAAASETSPKSQPWAETAAPAGRNKRALEDLLAEYAARVAAAPDAKATLPQEPSPAEAYLQKLSGAGGGAKRGGKRRWRGGRRRRGAGGAGSSDSSAGGGSAGGGAGTSGGGGGGGGGGRRRRGRGG
ncbi:MAG: hypothetical protein JOZ75_00545 [Candidatus Dormibacteraeota bacterium]|nr:hypothetical protein [Candidatus Dormibacteraeota bacterium]